MSSSSSPAPTIPEVTSTIPLTTIYTPGQGCIFGAVKTWSVAHKTKGNDGAKPTWFAQPRDLHECRPSGYGTKGQVPVYSPGVCPSGYYAAVPSDVADPATSYCCPLGASFPTVVGGPSYCFSSFTDNWIEVPAAPTPSSAAGGNVLVSLVEIIAGTPFGDTVVVGVQQPLTVTWQSSDLAQFTPTSAPLNNVAVSRYNSGDGSSIVSATHTGYSPPFASSSSSGGGLSTGAEAGIGVGVAVAALIIIGGLLWWFMRHRRAKSREQTSPTATDGYAAVPNGTTDHHTDSKVELGPDGAVNEIDGKGLERNELSSNHKPSEIGDSAERYELPGEYHGHEVPTEK